MKEHPILFKDEMIRAILKGRKTQTRRVVKLPKNHVWGSFFDGQICPENDLSSLGYPVDELRCPYGQPGDRLFVREAFRLCAEADGIKPRDTDAAYRVWYEADAPHQLGFGKLRPSMFMPRWASRITLEMTGVRVERLQACNEVDAIAEGAPWAAFGAPQEGSHKAGFAALWESINGPGSWDANPWVWCINFRRVA